MTFLVIQKLEMRYFVPFYTVILKYGYFFRSGFYHSISKNIEDDVKIDQILDEKFLQPLKNGKMRYFYSLYTFMSMCEHFIGFG